MFGDVVLDTAVDRRGPTSAGYWLSGRIDGSPLGSMTLVVNGDVVVGAVRVPGAAYAIRSVGSGDATIDSTLTLGYPASVDIDILHSVFSLLTAIFALIIAVIMLRFQAPPKIRITLECYRSDLQRCDRLPRMQRFVNRLHRTVRRHEPQLTAERLDAGQAAILRFKMENMGRLYVKPACTDTEFYVNLDCCFGLHVARFGSNLERCTFEQRFGKGMSRYFKVDGVHLFYDEDPECIVVRVTAPQIPGDYAIWIAAKSKQCEHAIFPFRVRVGPG